LDRDNSVEKILKNVTARTVENNSISKSDLKFMIGLIYSYVIVQYKKEWMHERFNLLDKVTEKVVDNIENLSRIVNRCKEQNLSKNKLVFGIINYLRNAA